MIFLLQCLIAWLALTERAAQAELPMVLAGRVVGPEGKPVAGAHVLGTLEWDRRQSTFAVATLGADGTFEHRLLPSEAKLRAIRVFAYAPGYSNAEELRTPPWGTPGSQRVTIRLRPTISLTVQVVDPGAAPVPTAVVTISSDSFSTEHPLKGVAQRVNAAGLVVFAGVNDKDSWNLAVSAPGYLTVHENRAKLDHPVTVQIARGGTVHGRLLDKTSLAPVTGCKLLTSAGEVATDFQGGFQFNAPYGDVSVEPSCPDYGTDWDLPASGLTVAFSATTAGQACTLHARHNQRVSGTVVDARGRAVSGVQVSRIFAPQNRHELRFLKHGPPRESATTDAKGGFVFDRSSMDEFELVIEGRKPWRSKFRFAELKDSIAVTLPK